MPQHQKDMGHGYMNFISVMYNYTFLSPVSGFNVLLF